MELLGICAAILPSPKSETMKLHKYAPIKQSPGKRGNRTSGYWDELVQFHKGSRLALDSDVVPAVPETGENSFALTGEALKQGALRGAISDGRAYRDI
jgi:hypothetical protein